MPPKRASPPHAQRPLEGGAAQMALLALPDFPPAGVAAGGAGRGASRFLVADSAGAMEPPAGTAAAQKLSKKRKAQRYRDLTCPRTRTSELQDGTRIVTVGSHVLVYPPPSAAAAGSGGPPAASHPRSQQSINGSVTTFTPHPLWSFPDEGFKHYSLGVGLYFRGVKLLAYAFALCTLIQLPSMILPVMVDYDLPSGATSDSGLFVEKTTLGNFGALHTFNSTSESSWGGLPRGLDRDSLTLLLSILDTASCLLLLLFCGWLSRRQSADALAHSRREITVRKYSVEVTNLPPFFHDRFQLAQWFERRFGRVVDVALAFEQHDLLDLYRRRGKLRKDIDMVVCEGDEGDRLEGMYDELGKIDARLDELQKDLARRRTLGAYVTFEFQESRIACERAFRNLWLRQLAGKISTAAASAVATTTTGSTATTPRARSTAPATTSSSAQQQKQKPQRQQQQHDKEEVDEHKDDSDSNSPKTLLFGPSRRVLQVVQAQEPSNIIFRNRKYSARNKLARKVATALATAVLILVSVLAVYVAQRYQGDVSTSAQSCSKSISPAEVESDPSLTDCFCYNLGTTAALDSSSHYGVDCADWLRSSLIARALSVLAVVVIVCINLSLKFFIQALALFERHSSVTHQQESITNKLFLGLFLNTGVVLLVVNMQLQHVGAANVGFTLAFSGKYADFVFEWFVHVGASIILTMILNTVNPHLLPLLAIPYRACRREICCPPRRSHSQAVWNERYGGEAFELAERYAVLLNTMFVVLLYSGGMPLLLPIGALTYALTYLFDRISFLRLYRIPPRFDHSLALYTTQLLPWAIGLHAAFSLWFFSSPPLAEVALDADSAAGGEDGGMGMGRVNYAVKSIAARIGGWPTLPTLVLLILLGSYLLFGRIVATLWELCTSERGFSSTDAPRDIHTSAGRGTASGNGSGSGTQFVPYSVARRTVTLETYHPHGSPFYHDAFLRTPSRKMMKIPTPLNVLAERAQRQEQARQNEVFLREEKEREKEQRGAQEERAKEQAIKNIPAHNASRSPLVAPPSVLHNLRVHVGSNGTAGSFAPAPAPSPSLSPSPPASDPAGLSGLDSAWAAPVLAKAASMGIDARRTMRMSSEALQAQKETAKAVARMNTMRFTTSRVAKPPVVEEQELPRTDAPLTVVVHPSKASPSPSPSPSFLLPPKPMPSVAEGNPPVVSSSPRLGPKSPLAPSPSPSFGPSSHSRRNAPVVSSNATQLTAGGSAHLPVPGHPALTRPSSHPSHTDLANATVVLDIPDDVAEALQRHAEAALASPSEERDDISGSGARAEGLADADRHATPRPFTSHLQHHARLQLPSSDPLLPRVQVEVHRLMRELDSDNDGAEEDDLREQGTRTLPLRPTAAATAPTRKSQPPAHASKRVADSSTAWGPPVNIGEPSLRLPAAAAAIGEASAGTPPIPASRSVSRSTSAAVAPGAARSGATTPTPVPVPAPSSVDADAYSVVPASCPNVECGRALELLDVGEPQMYHCPFCNTPFIM